MTAARAAVCATLVLACSEAMAQEAPEPDKLDEIEVGATPVVEGTEVSRYGDSVVTVGSGQLADQNASDLATALSRVPGVTFSRHNVVGAYGGGEGGTIYIRGHGSSRPGAEIGTLVDGVPKFSGIWTHPLLDMLPIDAASNVEVYKSAQPVLLGNMSFGAVNVVPKRMTEEGSEGRTMFGLGSFSTWTGTFEYGTKDGPFDWYVVGAHRDSEGHRENAGGLVDSLYARVGFDLSDVWQVSLQAHHSSSIVEDPEAEGTPLFFTPERFITDDDMAILTFENKTERAKGYIRLYYDDGLQDWEQWDDSGTPGDTTDDAPFDSITDYANYGLRVRQTMEPWRSGELVLGFDLDTYGGHFIEDHPTGGVSEADAGMTNTAPYVMLSHDVEGDWQVTPSAGARWNENDNFGGELGWQAGLKLERGSFATHLHFAHSFNYAGTYSAILFGGGAFDTLDAEQIEHIEIGFEWKPSKTAKLNVALYQDDVENGIRVVVVPPPEYQNVGAYTSMGAEVSYEAKPSRALDLYIGATYTDNDPSDLPYSPELTAVAGLSWRFSERWKLSATLNYLDEQWTGNPRTPQPNVLVGAYTTLNLRLGCRFTAFGSPTKGEFFIAGENVTDTDYELKPGYPMPGAAVTLGMDVRF